jgi:hypothetical protein
MELIEHSEPSITVPGPGFYRMPSFVYHGDPAPTPSLSSSCAKLLAFHTPAQAKAEHPRLNGKGYQFEAFATKMNVGSVVHELLSGHGDGIWQFGHDDWRSKAAKEDKARAVAEGRVPILQKDMERAVTVEQRIRDHLDQDEELNWVFNEGAGETALIWHDAALGIHGRALLDWWGGSERPGSIIDVKTTTGDLDDRSVMMRVLDTGMHIQQAWYERGLTALYPAIAGRIDYRIIFAQQVEPYGVRVVRLGKRYRWHGWRNAMIGAGIFADCLRTGEWPGWIPRTQTIDAPDWVERQQTEREVESNMLQHFHLPIMRATSVQAPLTLGDTVDGE